MPLTTHLWNALMWRLETVSTVCFLWKVSHESWVIESSDYTSCILNSISHFHACHVCMNFTVYHNITNPSHSMIHAFFTNSTICLDYNAPPKKWGENEKKAGRKKKALITQKQKYNIPVLFLLFRPVWAYPFPVVACLFSHLLELLFEVLVFEHHLYQVM